MKALILAAGYATRLYPLTLNKPKPLLKVGSKTMADRLVEKIERVKDVDAVYLVANDKFAGHFEEWAVSGERGKKVRVINDGTRSNETRLGGIGDMDLVIREAEIDDDLLVLGGDNLFEFDLNDFIGFAREKGGGAVALRDVGDLKAATKYGIVALGEDERVIEFIEKPENPKSTLAAMCVYFFPKKTLGLIKKYLAAGLNKDQPGNYISWLSENDRVYGFTIKDEWFDIGDKRQLRQADEVYKKKEKK